MLAMLRVLMTLGCCWGRGNRLGFVSAVFVCHAVLSGVKEWAWGGVVGGAKIPNI